MGEKLLSLILCIQSRSLSVATALRFFVWLWDTTEARQVSPGESQSDWSTQSPALQFCYLGFGLHSFCQIALRPTQHRPWWSLTNESECVGPKVPLAPQVAFNKETAWALLALYSPSCTNWKDKLLLSKRIWKPRGVCAFRFRDKMFIFPRRTDVPSALTSSSCVGWQCVRHH